MLESSATVDFRSILCPVRLISSHGTRKIFISTHVGLSKSLSFRSNFAGLLYSSILSLAALSGYMLMLSISMFGVGLKSFCAIRRILTCSGAIMVGSYSFRTCVKTRVLGGCFAACRWGDERKNCSLSRVFIPASVLSQLSTVRTPLSLRLGGFNCNLTVIHSCAFRCHVDSQRTRPALVRLCIHAYVKESALHIHYIVDGTLDLIRRTLPQTIT